MTPVSNALAVTGPYVASTASASSGVTDMSADALLAYCQMQLGSLDTEMKSQMDSQDLALQQRTAVESVQTTLEAFGTIGPQTYEDLNKCSQAFDAAIAKLPPGDPVAAQLTSQKNTMNTTYGVPPQGIANFNFNGSNPPSGPLTKPPQNDDWKGTTDALGNLADGIKSNAEIQMLQLQDLVSQRQQAVEQVTGMMSKEDETLDDGAKAIGQ